MDLREQFVREIFESYFTRSFTRILPALIRNAIQDSNLHRQEFVPIHQVSKQFDISLRTLYNYHKKGYITLRTTERKTFVSVFELEEHIRKHPVQRNPW
ncbi:MAG TPA: hypothetical protein PLJ60_14150 [Chryseolinea sp.]|jgi:hypothetical protein|nr:hypothetical protein [Chryseolinea sp.]